MNRLFKTLEKPKKWHSLTEMPEHHEVRPSQKPGMTEVNANKNALIEQARHPLLLGVSADLIKLLWDILCYMYSSVSVRIKRSGTSVRRFKNTEHEGCEKGFILKSAAGQTIYLIPTRKAFETFDMPCPYKRAASIEHSYYVLWGCFLLKKNPRYKSVQPEVKRGDSGSTSDIVTVAHDGIREVWEVTLNTTNILSNASKYENTDFVSIVFLCRDYRLREAVKACCREGGLNPDLLGKLDYMQFSTLLRRQRRLSLY